MSRPIRVGTVAVHHQGGERALHGRFVGGIETRFSADSFHMRIAQIPLRGGEQPLDFLS
ncbi:MAG: hypothetical protein WDO68_24225 [Gammaproteobacteria bacterium]